MGDKWANQPPVHPQSKMNICFCCEGLHQARSRTLRRAASGNSNVVVRSQWAIQSLKCLAQALEFMHNLMPREMLFFKLCLIFKFSLWEAGRERLLCLKRQHLSLGNLGLFLRKQQSFIVLGRKSPLGSTPLPAHPAYTYRAPPFSSSFLQAPS